MISYVFPKRVFDVNSKAFSPRNLLISGISASVSVKFTEVGLPYDRCEKGIVISFKPLDFSPIEILQFLTLQLSYQTLLHASLSKERACGPIAKIASGPFCAKPL